MAEFGPVLGSATPADLYLDASGLESTGVTVEEIASWIGTYTLGENLPEGATGRDLVPDDRLDDTLYAAAFTSDFLADPSVDLETLGAGDYGTHGRFPVVYNFGR